jgi:hypothetical protein
MDRVWSLLITSFLLLLASSCGEKPTPVSSEAWAQLASMPTARSEHTAAVVNGVIHEIVIVHLVR